MTGRVFIVRHGNTFSENELVRRIGRRTDMPLAQSGVAQAQALGRWFASHDIHFHRAQAAPLLRTRETAALILREQAEPPALADAAWLAEIDHGPDEDQPEEAVVARIGAAALKAWDSQGVPPPGWEVDAEGRLEAWRRLLVSPAPGNTLLVTSNGAARFALLALGRLPALSSMKLRPGSFGEILTGDRADHPLLVSWDVGTKWESKTLRSANFP